jgi:hypothetical protein
MAKKVKEAIMKNYSIEIDEKVWNYLKGKAEPLVDTPNTVLHKVLFGENSVSVRKIGREHPVDADLCLPSGIPKALEQILEVIYEVKKLGRSRNEATNIVAERRKTAPQTVIDKYCRQLGKRAYEIDSLLLDQNLDGFRVLLESKFANHRDLISSFFHSLGDGKSFSVNKVLEDRK